MAGQAGFRIFDAAKRPADPCSPRFPHKYEDLRGFQASPILQFCDITPRKSPGKSAIFEVNVAELVMATQTRADRTLMYEQHFGLKRRPFRAVTTGADVFVGPQTAKIMHAIKLAMATSDAVITVMGPAGVGKTTIVGRTLGSLDSQKLIIRIARIKLGHDEVLDFLLDELQAANVPASTIRKVALFRELVADRTAAGVRVAIVVEDAMRIGEDALAELEALTSADGNDFSGASLILMGEESLRDELDSSALVRLKQRVRAYQFVQPLTAPELGAYMKHCFRLADGDYDSLFDGTATKYIHELTGGNPRTANNLLESVLTAASAQSLPNIPNTLIAEVAESQFGLNADLPETSGSKTAEATPDPADNRASEPESAGAAMGKLEKVEEALSALETAPTDDTPVADLDSVAAALNDIEPVDEPAQDSEPANTAHDAEAPAKDDVPELLHSTLPDLEVLAPGLAQSPDATTKTAAVLEPAETADSEIPTLETSARILMTESDPEPIPELNEDPEPALENVIDIGTEVDSQVQAKPASVEPQVQAEPTPVEQKDPAKPQQIESPVQAEPEPVEPESDPTLAELQLDPTLAELQPDLDVLEEALAANLASSSDDDIPPPPQTAAPEPEIKDPTTPSLPTITLDAAIQENIAEATAALEMQDATIREKALQQDSSGIAGGSPKQAGANDADISDTDIRNIASGIRKAVSLEDVDDRMAETLFGAEFSSIAAQVIANPPPAESANQDIAVATGSTEATPEELPLELSLVEDSIITKRVDANDSGDGNPPAPATKIENGFDALDAENAVEVSLESEKANPGMDLSASQRLATVRALNANQLPAGAMPPKPAPSKPAPATLTPGHDASSESSAPQPIEEQISTSMTATLKALSIRPDSANDEDDEDEQPKKGFFSRFRRS